MLKATKIQVAAIAFACGMITPALVDAIRNIVFEPIDNKTNVYVVNRTPTAISITIRESKVYSGSQIPSGATFTRSLPNIGLYEVTASAPDGKVMGSETISAVDNRGVKLEVVDGTIREVGYQPDA